jgi:hypothetical protein
MIYAKKLKKKCMVRGCGNTETFALSRSGSEFGNVFICASCLAEALSGVDEARKAYAERNQANKVSSPPPLFYNPVVEKAVEEPAEIEEVEPEANEEVSEVEETAEEPSEKCICTECGKEFDTEKGLNMHKRIHEKE